MGVYFVICSPQNCTIEFSFFMNVKLESAADSHCRFDSRVFDGCVACSFTMYGGQFFVSFRSAVIDYYSYNNL